MSTKNIIFGRSKYNARKVKIDGITFDSLRESQKYAYLKLLLDQGLISVLKVHPKYELIPKPYQITYVADFFVQHLDGRVEVIDVKGFETPVWKLKAKLFRWRYPHLPLTVVK